MNLEDIVVDQILSEPEHVQAQILMGLPMSIQENILSEASIRRKKKAVTTIVPAMRRLMKQPDIRLLRWALHKYPVTVGQMTDPRTLRTCLSHEITVYYSDDDDGIDLITFLRWLDGNDMLCLYADGSEFIDIVYQILVSYGGKRQSFCIRVLETYYDVIHDSLDDDRRMSSALRDRYRTSLNGTVDDHTELSYEGFESLIPFIGDVEMNELYDLLPRDIQLGRHDIELLLSLLDDKRDLLRLYATIPSFEQFNKHSRYFNR
jgi:hypothetical protein